MPAPASSKTPGSSSTILPPIDEADSSSGNAPTTSTHAPANGSGSKPPRTRATRACTRCRSKRIRCDGADSPCGPCREIGHDECVYHTSRKRGPPKGYVLGSKKARLEKKLAAERAAEESVQDASTSQVPQQAAEHSSPVQPSLAQSSSSSSPSEEESETPSISFGTSSVPRLPTEVLSPAFIEHLLALYFAHTHPTWPIIYKPLFHHARVLPVLLWSILALAACISHPTPTSNLPPNDLTPNDEMSADALFNRAISEVQRYAGESRIELVQALVLLSLRQTGNGMKSSAWMLSGQASAMAIDLGLHNAGRVGQGQAQKADNGEESRRVWWCAFVLDKTLAEETGRPYILRSRRCTTPLPSVQEPDEYELWPSPTASLYLPALARINPRRSHVLTTFNATCRLGLIVEKIMDLEEEGPCLEGFTGAEGEMAARGPKQMEDPEMLRQRDVLSEMLDDWWINLPSVIQVRTDDQSVCPCPHFVVNIAWYHSARILIHSRFINSASRAHDRRSSSAAKYFDPLLPQTPSNGIPSTPDPKLVRSHGLSHAICTDAGDAIVKLIALLDRWNLLSSSSSDVIHLVSHATLFQVYNSSLSDIALANRAKVNFAQCCMWLKTFSASWPSASHHKTFFEGLISGGLDLSPVTDNDPHINPALYPSPAASNVPPPTSAYQPGYTPTFSHPSTEPPPESVHRPHTNPPSTTLSPTSFFKTPSYFWNQAVPSAMTIDRAGGGGGIDPSALQTPIGDFGQGFVNSPSTWTTPTDLLDGGQPVGGGGGGGGMYDSVGLTNHDGPINNEVYSALVEYMMKSSS